MRKFLFVLTFLIGLMAWSLPMETALAHEGEGRPTVVLVHGAWAGPSSWARVVRLLHEEGYRTVTPALGLTSLAGDTAIVTSALDQIPGKKILVGHSYGGAVISNASAGRSDVGALVYSAAFIPDQGDTLAGLGAGFAPPGVVPHLVWSGVPFAPGSLASIEPAFFRQFFAQDLSAGRASQLAAAQQPIAFIPVFVTPSGPVGWHRIPSWYQVSGADRMIDPNEERFMAARAGATTLEFPNASHVGGITVHAEQFTDLIDSAIEATSQATN